MKPLLRTNGWTALILTVLVAGCATRPTLTLQLYEEVAPDLPSSMMMKVDVPRANLRIPVNTAPTLTERDVDSAELIQTAGGAAVMLHFDPHGAMVLDEMTTRCRGKFLVAMLNSRPVAAIRIGQRLPLGQLLLEGDFTDAEAGQIVEAMNKEGLAGH